jgi:hypothetical protein
VGYLDRATPPKRLKPIPKKKKATCFHGIACRVPERHLNSAYEPGLDFFCYPPRADPVGLPNGPDAIAIEPCCSKTASAWRAFAADNTLYPSSASMMDSARTGIFGLSSTARTLGLAPLTSTSTTAGLLEG